MRIFSCIREDGEVQRINNIYKCVSISSVLSADYSNVCTLHVSCLIYT